MSEPIEKKSQVEEPKKSPRTVQSAQLQQYNMAKALSKGKKVDMDQLMLEEAMKESVALPDKKRRVSPRDRKQEVKTFRRSELCLVCQMNTLFIQYQF